VLFEDVDCMIGEKSRVKKENSLAGTPTSKSEAKPAIDKFGVTLSGLLNVLDGFHAPDDVLYMMTTNKIETLDPALLRPGRIDYRLYLGVASEQQKLELYCRFFPQADEFEARAFVEAHPWAETMADFQGLLLALEEDSVELRRAETPAGCLQENEEPVAVTR
jgi:chaperone BCS1